MIVLECSKVKFLLLVLYMFKNDSTWDQCTISLILVIERGHFIPEFKNLMWIFLRKTGYVFLAPNLTLKSFFSRALFYQEFGTDFILTTCKKRKVMENRFCTMCKKTESQTLF